MTYQLDVVMCGEEEYRFEGDKPESFNRVEARTLVIDRMVDEFGQKHQTSFNTAQEYSPPGFSTETKVGVLIVGDNGEMEFDFVENPLEGLEEV